MPSQSFSSYFHFCYHRNSISGQMNKPMEKGKKQPSRFSQSKTDTRVSSKQFCCLHFHTSRFEKLTTVTNILLLNLILSSTIFMSSLPFMAVYMQLSDWVFGSVMCKVVGGMYYLGIYSSVLFLTLLTFDRHLAVVYSLSAVRSLSYARISCVVVWLVSLLACAKQMILHTTFTHAFENRRFCDEYPLLSPLHSQLKAAGFYLQLFLFLLFPLAVIIYCYVRIAITVISSKLASKFRTVRLIIFIVVLFFMCWTPFNIALLLDDTDDCEESQNRDYVLQITRNLAYLYFCISPILYTFVGRKFQNYFRQMLVKRFPALKNRVSVSQSGTNGSTRTTRNDL